MAIRQYRPSDPTNFAGEKAKTVAEIRRWSWRLKSEEGLEGKKHTSAFRGVCWCSNREVWETKIEVSGETNHLGRFSSEIEAAQAYDRAALRLHDTANTNFPPSDYDATEGEELP
jgi:AP2 domain.